MKFNRPVFPGQELVITRLLFRRRERAAAIARHPATRSNRSLTPSEIPGCETQYFDRFGSPVSEATARANASRDPISWRSDFKNRRGIRLWVVTQWRYDVVAPYLTVLRAGIDGQIRGQWSSRTLDQAHVTHREVCQVYGSAK